MHMKQPLISSSYIDSACCKGEVKRWVRSYNASRRGDTNILWARAHRRYVRFRLEAAEEGVNVFLWNVTVLLSQVGVKPDKGAERDPRSTALFIICQNLAGELQGSQEALK